MAEREDWILQNTDNFLNAEVFDASGYNKYSSDYYGSGEGGSYSKNRLSNVEGNVWYGSSALWDAQREAKNAGLLTGEYTAGGNMQGYGSSYAAVQVKSGAYKSLAQRAGYNPQGYNEYYGGKYGTEFSEADIEGALTGKYGEVKGKQGLGEGWKGLYNQLETWKAQDKGWYDAMQEAHGMKGSVTAMAEAKMSAGGMKAGSKGWNQTLGKMEQLGINVDAEYAEKQEALKGTGAYKELSNIYESLYMKPETRIKGETVTNYKDVMTQAGYTRPAYEQVQNYFDQSSQSYKQRTISRPERYIPPVYSSVPFQEYQEKETETGNLMYGAEDGKTPMGMDDFFLAEFGTPDMLTSEVSNQDTGYSSDYLEARSKAGGVA